eukprot:TRINITY_DN9706_c0_g1_i1.p1 TRINITY_DN9706_c0_g1~~TRINITY_DN9706_c0_g1_i1.p1  ORF type:complete len:287 (+),score=43.15 TRINITY_DN9706_c0_g1_i1:54-914(+)
MASLPASSPSFSHRRTSATVISLPPSALSTSSDSSSSLSESSSLLSSTSSSPRIRRIALISVLAFCVVTIIVLPAVLYVQRNTTSSSLSLPLPNKYSSSLPSTASSDDMVLLGNDDDVEDGKRPPFPSIDNSSIPCIYGHALPMGCSPRIQEIACDDDSDPPNIGVTSSRCDHVRWGEIQKVRFQVGRDDATRGKCYQITAAVSECWGVNPFNGNDYECQGRCGAGCGGIPGGWSAGCWKHDICSYYFGATGGSSDEFCGLAFKQASRDFMCGMNSLKCAPFIYTP